MPGCGRTASQASFAAQATKISALDVGLSSARDGSLSRVDRLNDALPRAGFDAGERADGDCQPKTSKNCRTRGRLWRRALFLDDLEVGSVAHVGVDAGAAVDADTLPCVQPDSSVPPA